MSLLRSYRNVVICGIHNLCIQSTFAVAIVSKCLYKVKICAIYVYQVMIVILDVRLKGLIYLKVKRRIIDNVGGAMIYYECAEKMKEKS